MIANAQPSHAGSYHVVLSNALGVATSDPMTLQVVDSAPGFMVQPLNQTVTAGTNVSLTALAQGSDPIGYQWRKTGPA